MLCSHSRWLNDTAAPSQIPPPIHMHTHIHTQAQTLPQSRSILCEYWSLAVGGGFICNFLLYSSEKKTHNGSCTHTMGGARVMSTNLSESRQKNHWFHAGYKLVRITWAAGALRGAECLPWSWSTAAAAASTFSAHFAWIIFTPITRFFFFFLSFTHC